VKGLGQLRREVSTGVGGGGDRDRRGGVVLGWGLGLPDGGETPDGERRVLADPDILQGGDVHWVANLLVSRPWTKQLQLQCQDVTAGIQSGNSWF